MQFSSVQQIEPELFYIMDFYSKMLMKPDVFAFIRGIYQLTEPR